MTVPLAVFGLDMCALALSSDAQFRPLSGVARPSHNDPKEPFVLGSSGHSVLLCAARTCHWPDTATTRTPKFFNRRVPRVESYVGAG